MAEYGAGAAISGRRSLFARPWFDEARWQPASLFTRYGGLGGNCDDYLRKVELKLNTDAVACLPDLRIWRGCVKRVR